MNVKTEALAFRIWAFAKPKGWDCTIYDIADFVRETPQRIVGVCRVKGWNGRLRSSSPYYLDTKIDMNETWASSDPLIGEEKVVN
jgi:hypothetical protein